MGWAYRNRSSYVLESFERVVDILDHTLEGGGWILGERFLAADVMLGSDLWFGTELMKIVPPRTSGDRCRIIAWRHKPRRQ